jgi:hypothetical protein
LGIDVGDGYWKAGMNFKCVITLKVFGASRCRLVNKTRLFLQDGRDA